MRRVEQVEPYAHFPTGDGRTVAVLRFSPDHLRDRYQLHFERGLDSLDEFDLAAVADPQVGQIWFFRHVRSPMAGTEVMVDVAESRSRALAALRRALGVRAADLEWISEHECDPRLEFIRASRS